MATSGEREGGMGKTGVGFFVFKGVIMGLHKVMGVKILKIVKYCRI